MGKKRNRDKVQVKVTDVATDECNSVYDMDAEELPCTPSKSPPGKKGKVKMNIDEKIAVINAVAELTSKCDGSLRFRKLSPWRRSWKIRLILSPLFLQP